MRMQFACLVPILMTIAALPVGAHDEHPPELLGQCSAEQLDAEPYSEWARAGYDDYFPNPAVLKALSEIDTAGTTFKVFFGTWCGDSRREVPRMLKLLESRRVVPRDTFMDDMGVSRATFKRDLEYLVDRLNAPILYDRALRGYRLDNPPGARRYELPGVWFSAGEAHALLTAQYLLEQLQPGFLKPYIDALSVRIRALLDAGDHSADEVQHRIRVLPQAARPVRTEHFETISSAVLGRQRLRIRYHSRSQDEETEREISPQRLVHYRDNWYLDAWCHLRKGLRTFSLDGVRHAERLEAKAKDVSDAELDKVLGAGYGIFSGEKTETAVLRFSPERARWVASEQWHPKQVGRYEQDGYYTLEIPYSDIRELTMEILRHGPDVQVLEPDSLRKQVQALHAKAASH